MNKYINIIPGLLLTSFIAFLSIYIEPLIFIGSVAAAIFIGFIINNILLRKFKICTPGIEFSEKTLLSMAIILLGATLDFTFLNYKSIIMILFIISTSIFICYIIGNFLGLRKQLSILIGIGNGICGSSAIAGTSKVIGAKKEEIGLSIGIINFLGAISIPLLPLVLLTFFPFFTDEQNGFVIGSTVQALGQVVASGNVISNSVGDYATIIKMIRIAMLGPIILLLNLVVLNKPEIKTNSSIIFPKFIIGFIICAILAQLNFFPEYLIDIFKKISKILLVIAMAGVGLKISLKDIMRFGKKSFFVGSLGFVFQLILACFIAFYYF